MLLITLPSPPLLLSLRGLVNVGVGRLKIRVALTGWGDRGRTNTPWPLNNPHLGLLARIRVGVTVSISSGRNRSINLLMQITSLPDCGTI